MVVLAKKYADIVPVILDVSSLEMAAWAKLVSLFPIRQIGSHQNMSRLYSTTTRSLSSK
jgi:hypothetical protein